MQKRGAIWISAIIYVLVVLGIMVIVLEAGVPFIQGLGEKNAFAKVQDTLSGLDGHIKQIASEGQGSQRIVPLEVTDGELRVEDQKLRWKLETENKIVEPRTRIELGNLIIAADVDVSARTEGSFYTVENSRIRINFTKIGSASSFATINTSTLVNSVYFKDTGESTSGTFTFYVNDSTSLSGNGYTELLDSGSGLTSAQVKAHINNSAMSYDLLFTLDSKADFFKVDVENFERK